ncbi:hypothetical protein EDB19DRAFT_1894790 [Suillus lakei]|nr:hypothetical protein EDB19DRAFT_1894790 [Suillus lakei]
MTKGIFKDHLVKWCLEIVSEEELNTCFKVMPDYPGLWHFKKGISTMRQWTGTEHKEMQYVFISLLTGAVPSMLAVFHANKDILQELEVCEHFNIPKLHQISHFIKSITLFDSTDGFNTKLPEQLHIDFTKDAYHASNKHDYEEQMALWLQWQEVIFLCNSYLDWLSEQSHATPSLPIDVVHVLAKTPTYLHQSIDHLIIAHGTTMFLPALKSFLHKHMLCNNIVPIVIVTPPDPCASDSPKQWHIRVTPEVQPGAGPKPGSPTRFDMALISDGVQMLNLWTFKGVQVVQVHIIFTLPHQFQVGMFS